MVEPAELNGVASVEPASASDVRQVTVRQGVVDSTIISGDGNTVTIIHQYSRAEAGLEQPAQPLTGFPPGPYKGLEAFYEEDADRFFGRSAVVDTLWRRLRDLQALPLPGQPPRTRLLAIIGPSGSGKSSVARAGLIPELARRPIPGQANPRVALVVPHTEPIEALATVLARLATNDPAPAAKTREFAEEIRRVNQSGVPDGLRRIANVLPAADRHPLIVLVDQFEEVFTGAAEAERSLFIETLLDLASDGSGRISVVLTLRSDFLSATARYPVLDAAIAAGSELVPAISKAELEEAISLPAVRAAKGAGMPNPLDQATVELLVQETIGRAGLDNRTNNTSLVLAFEFIDTRRVMLFAADAQVGNWLSWQDLAWTVNNAKVTGPDLLARTVYLKVGHHGSHNGTLRAKGLELMTSSDLVALIPTNAADAKRVGWRKMPLPALLTALEDATGGRVIRTDDEWVVRGSAAPAELERESAAIRVTSDRKASLYVDVLVS